jgi:hypothetical protein
MTPLPILPHIAPVSPSVHQGYWWLGLFSPGTPPTLRAAASPRQTSRQGASLDPKRLPHRLNGSSCSSTDPFASAFTVLPAARYFSLAAWFPYSSLTSLVAKIA